MYIALFAAVCAPGLPLGFALFGRTHAAGWVCGALIGYGLTAVAVRLPLYAGLDGIAPAFLMWGALTILMFALIRRTHPLVALPVWSRRDTAALLLTALVVPLLVWKPFVNVGRVDEDGGRRFRAYFTADFLWHVALTAELTKSDKAPRNPYLARQKLNYYWAYFVPPAAISDVRDPAAIETNLLLNALCAGLLFASAVFVAAWAIVPRAGPVAAGVVLAFVAASAEGWHAVVALRRVGRPLSDLRHLNIDAVTAWFLEGLTVDGLPRSLWYTPQHAMACAVALMALAVPAHAAARQPLVGVAAGVPLGLAVILSPFLGGAFCLVYGLAAFWHGARRRDLAGHLMTAAPAVLAAAAGLAWCVMNDTFEGAGAAIALGLSQRAAEAPEALLLAAGPVLTLAAAGLILGRRHFPLAAPAIAVAAGILAFHFVTLTTDPIWIGWRAGQVMLVSAPALIAAALAALIDKRGVRIAAAVAGAVFVIGVPTTAIDVFNAQDIRNLEMGAGFRWTVVLPRDAQAALAWIRDNTEEDAIVQMSIGPRGRETWTSVPSFAHRRMAAGQPISLLRTPEYAELSDRADWIFRAPLAHEAARIAKALRVDYVYVDGVERDAFGDLAIAKFDDACCFAQVFKAGEAAVYAVK